MAPFDHEMKLFEEIKNKYTPIKGYHLVLVLDLDAYKTSKEILFKFKIDSEVYRYLVNTKYAHGNKACVIITANEGSFIEYDSSWLYILYNYDKKIILELYDKTPNPYKLNRSLKHQMQLLVYDLTYPKPDKPAC